MARRKPTRREQEAVWDNRMLQAIADHLQAPLWLVVEAYVKELEYRCKVLKAQAETHNNMAEAIRAFMERRKREHEALMARWEREQSLHDEGEHHVR
jgi:hypothetical protein